VLSALAVAVQMIDAATQGKNGNPLKYERRIIIVTDGRGEIDATDIDEIGAKLKTPGAEIELVILGVDFDDPESGYKEEDKDPEKVRNQRS
jgi:ATP-dependent DNA helicase 2 subunit 2